MVAVLRYVGVPAQFDVQPNSGLDLVTQSYVAFLLSLNMTSDQVGAQITSLLTPYATKSTADSLMTGLATPSYISTQIAGYVEQNAVDQVNGPISLDSVSDLLEPGLINVASTQTWPLPFWSPTSYPSSFTFSEPLAGRLLFSVALPDPGYSYIVACFGMFDIQMETDGEAAQIQVVNGSFTGPTIAVGYSNSESYSGPAPGDLTAAASMSSTQILTGAWASVGPLIAQTGTGFSSVIVGSFLLVPENMDATLLVSLNFSGAVPRFAQTVQTTARIVDNAGVVIATGSTVPGDSGVLTVSWTGAVFAGQSYGVQVMEGATGNPILTTPNTYGTISGGTFSINPPTVPTTSMANIIPTSLGQQPPTSGPTTLYVMLSFPSAGATVLTDFPAFWAMPIPIAVTGSPPPDVAHDAVSTGFTNVSLGASFTDSITVAAGAFVVTYIVVDRTSTVSSITCGGLTMDRLISPVSFTNGALTGNAVIYCYGALISSSQTATISVTMSNSAFITSFSSSYLNVEALLFSSVPATNNASPSQGVTSSSGQMIVQAFGSSVASLTTPTGGVVRYNTTNAGKAALCVQDATATTVFGGTYPSAQWWAAAAVVLLP